MTHVFVGPHPDTLGDGTSLALDQIVDVVDLDDPHNQRLVAKGWLIEHTQQPKPQKAPKAPRRARTKEST